MSCDDRASAETLCEKKGICLNFRRDLALLKFAGDVFVIPREMFWRVKTLLALVLDDVNRGRFLVSLHSWGGASFATPGSLLGYLRSKHVNFEWLDDLVCSVDSWSPRDAVNVSVEERRASIKLLLDNYERRHD